MSCPEETAEYWRSRAESAERVAMDWERRTNRALVLAAFCWFVALGCALTLLVVVFA